MLGLVFKPRQRIQSVSTRQQTCPFERVDTLFLLILRSIKWGQVRVHQWVEALATMLDNLHSMLGTQTVEEKLLKVVLSP